MGFRKGSFVEGCEGSPGGVAERVRVRGKCEEGKKAKSENRKAKKRSKKAKSKARKLE